jgi:hypothetical protein
MSDSWRELEALVVARIRALLGEALGLDPKTVRVGRPHSDGYDMTARAGGRAFLVDVKERPTPVLLTSWKRMRGVARKNELPLLVVPFMSPSGRALCAEHGLNWMDLAGNASVHAPGLHIHVEGRGGYSRPGRPSSVFERRSSRVVRLLLQHPGRDWTVRECSRQAGLNEGHVSRIVATLVADEYLRRDGKRLRVIEPQRLLDGWRDAADFSRNRILRGHVAARSGEELLALVSSRLSKLEHAVTGLGAAWLYDHFAMFRLATFYLREMPSPEQLERLHFNEEPNGGNLWLVVPADDGVFQGARVVGGVPCVHPVQVYVDLKEQPERAAEAAAHLKENPLLLGASSAAS